MQPRSPGVFPVRSCFVLSRRKTDDCLPEYGCTRHNCLCHYPGDLPGTYRRSRLGVAEENALQYAQVTKNSGIIKEYRSLACCGGDGCGLAAETVCRGTRNAGRATCRGGVAAAWNRTPCPGNHLTWINYTVLYDKMMLSLPPYLVYNYQKGV